MPHLLYLDPTHPTSIVMTMKESRAQAQKHLFVGSGVADFLSCKLRYLQRHC
jgi:hypothetical protein